MASSRHKVAVSREFIRTLGLLTDTELAHLRDEALNRTFCRHCGMPVTAHGDESRRCPPKGPGNYDLRLLFSPVTVP